MKKGDYIIIAALLLAAAVLFAAAILSAGEKGMTAVVTVDGEEQLRLPLDRDEVYTVESAEGTCVVRVSGGSVCVESSTCRSGDCVAQGSISNAGEAIVCLPNRVTVTVEDGGGLDSVAY